MSENENPAPAEADTATMPDSPEATGEETTQEINWQKRAEDAQAWATRAAQEAAELRQWQEAIRTDPEAQRKFLAEELGYELEDDTPDDPFDDDPVSALEQRLAAIEAKEQQAEAERELAKTQQHFVQTFATIESETGEPLDAEDRDWLITRALTSDPLPNGEPDIKGAHAALVARDKARQEKWAAANAPKRRPSHQFTPSGVAGEDKPDRSTHEGRVAAMLNKLSDTA